MRCSRKFTNEDDESLKEGVKLYGEDWNKVKKYMQTDKTTRQLSDRYKYYLDPNINWNEFNNVEDSLLCDKVKTNGHKWVAIKVFFPNRTEYQLKNRFNLLQRKINAEEETSKRRKEKTTTNKTKKAKLLKENEREQNFDEVQNFNEVQNFDEMLSFKEIPNIEIPNQYHEINFETFIE